MSLEKKQISSNSIILVVGIMATMYTSMLIATSSTSAMLSDFPDLAPQTLQQILTLNSLSAAVMCLLTGVLTQKFRVKTLSVISFLIMGVFGVGPAFLTNFKLILACHLLYGIGMGLNLSLMPTVINWYLPESKRGSATGIKQVGTNVGMIIFTYLSGVLSALNWRYPFYVYFVSFIVAIVVLVILPKKEDDIDIPAGGGRSFNLPGYAWGWIFLLFLSQICVYVWQTNLSQLIVGGMGGTNTQTGYVGVATGIGGIIGGLLLSKVTKALGRFTIPVCFAIYACTLLVNAFLGAGSSMMIAYVNAFIHGIVYFIYNGMIILNLGNSVEKRQQGVAVSMGMTALQLGNFVVPYVMVPMATAIFGREMPQDRFLLGGIGCLIASMIFLIIALRKAKIAYTYHTTPEAK